MYNKSIKNKERFRLLFILLCMIQEFHVLLQVVKNVTTFRLLGENLFIINI